MGNLFFFLVLSGACVFASADVLDLTAGVLTSSTGLENAPPVLNPGAGGRNLPVPNPAAPDPNPNVPSLPLLKKDEKVQICECEKDYDLLRDYWAKNSCGTRVDDCQDSVTTKGNLPVYLSTTNLTVVTKEITLSGLESGKLEQAYTEKGNLVITVDFSEKGLIFKGVALIAVHQNGDEPVVIEETFSTSLPAIITAVIPLSNGLNAEALKQGNYTSFAPNTDAPLTIGSKYSASCDPRIQNSYQTLNANMKYALAETLTAISPVAFLNWLQSNICNFNLNPILDSYDPTILNKINDAGNQCQYESPCDCADRKACVAKFLQDKGSCNLVCDPSDEVDKIPYYNDFPIINASNIYTGCKVKDLSKATIEKFAINKKTNNLVLVVNSKRTISCRELTLYTHQRGELPKINSDFGIATYSIIVTIVVDLDKKITAESLFKSFRSGFYTKAPKYTVGPKFVLNPDPQIIKSVLILATQPVQFGQQAEVWENYNLLIDYTQSQLCNFGITN